MECKSFSHALHLSKVKELIDTLWNVNYIAARGAYLFAPELIDTLWNVNEKKRVNQRWTRHRINRYIMECK